MASKSISTSISTDLINIPLRRLPSKSSTFKRTSSLLSTNTTTITLPKYTSLPSINTTTTSLLPSITSTQNFNPTTTLQIQSLGKPALSFPLPAKQLEFPIYSLSEDSLGAKYINIKPKRRSGNCNLIQVGSNGEEDVQVASTTYVFGPGRYPVVRIGKSERVVEDGDGDVLEGVDGEEEVDEFEMQGKWFFSKTTYFVSTRWGRFEWRYAGRKERAMADVSGKKSINNLLVLERVIGSERTKVAQLIRGEGIRMPGTGSTCAGNGGRLEMCLDVGEGELIDEVTVLVTCLVMLKKEIDRLRAIQIAAMSGSGGCWLARYGRCKFSGVRGSV